MFIYYTDNKNADKNNYEAVLSLLFLSKRNIENCCRHL